MKKPREKKHNGYFVIAVAVCLLCGILVYKKWNLQNEKATLEQKIQSLNRQLEDERERADELAYLKLFQNSDRYIEYIARTRLGLVYKDEVIFREENEDSR